MGNFGQVDKSWVFLLATHDTAFFFQFCETGKSQIANKTGFFTVSHRFNIKLKVSSSNYFNKINLFKVTH